MPGQLVISGETVSVKACEALKAAGAKRALILPVNVIPFSSDATSARKTSLSNRKN